MLEALIVDAFVKDGRGGNPAGVVLDAAGIGEPEMLAVAKRMGLSETAFVFPSKRATFRVRFFTPTAEVDLCGHATVATWALLHREGRVAAGRHSQETKAGVLAVEVGADGSVMMDQALPSFLGEAPIEKVAKALAAELSWVVGRPTIVSTGLPDLLVEVNGRACLHALRPHFEALADLSRELGVVGAHLFTMDVLDPKSTAHCRNFAPLYGIEEESATGTSNGALAAHLFRERRLKKAGELRFEQGYSMDRPSEIRARLEASGGSISRVQVGGAALQRSKKS